MDSGAIQRQQRLAALGRRMKAVAKAQGLGSQAIAARMGTVGASTIRHWWSGRYGPPYDELALYAEAVAVPIYVLTGEAEQFANQAAAIAYQTLADQLGMVMGQILAGASVSEALAQIGPPVGRSAAAALQAEMPELLQAIEQWLGPDWEQLDQRQRREKREHLVAQLHASAPATPPPAPPGTAAPGKAQRRRSWGPPGERAARRPGPGRAAPPAPYPDRESSAP